MYQFWQKEKKDEVNASERKIGGADLGPVTQLFTENYMVRFLLENSLGAWWAARHPDSPLIKGFEYLRFNEEGQPAAGTFDHWPERVADVTVIPCCGSGHFLVEAFSCCGRCVRKRRPPSITAQDAVVRDNLFGLELDPRCVQIAMFALAFQAWMAGGGWRPLPVPNIACSGIPVKAPVDEWKALAAGDERLERALVRLHILFRDADTLGNLIDPGVRPRSLIRRRHRRRWTTSTGMRSLRSSRHKPPVRGLIRPPLCLTQRRTIARAADFLSRRYTLAVTNVPYLTGNVKALICSSTCRPSIRKAKRISQRLSCAGSPNYQRARTSRLRQRTG